MPPLAGTDTIAGSRGCVPRLSAGVRSGSKALSYQGLALVAAPPPNKQKDVFGRLFFMPEIPRPRPLPTARQQDALPKQGVVSLQLRARHGAPASGEGQEALLVGHEGLLAELALMGAERHLRAQLPGRWHVPDPGHG